MAIIITVSNSMKLVHYALTLGGWDLTFGAAMGTGFGVRNATGHLPSARVHVLLHRYSVEIHLHGRRRQKHLKSGRAR